MALPPAADARQQVFEQQLQQLLAWRERYYECIVPRAVHDAPGLGEWVHALRRQRKLGRLSEEQIARLDAAGFLWQVDTVTAKWYSNLHLARQYRELHGKPPPPDLRHPGGNARWEEAGRWLERQRDLYWRQKLLAVRVRLLKEVLGVKLVRPKGPTRRNLHPVIRRENAAFEQELARRREEEAAVQSAAHEPRAASAGVAAATGVTAAAAAADAAGQ